MAQLPESSAPYNMAEGVEKGEMPDVRKARTRLGTLLQTIKANPQGTEGVEDDEIHSEISEQEASQIASHVLKTKSLYGSAGMLTVEVSRCITFIYHL